MNMFKNTYGKLAAFYFIIMCFMIYLAYDYTKTQMQLKDYFDGYADGIEDAEIVRVSAKEKREEAPLQTGNQEI